ncbi:hypothetical protein ABEF86_16520 (plasmid) [Acinetobacter thermotolerans]|uniref:hypothetical protein n=1 Tax=Acinetobacter thermotolerans TaxID=3151487 RepID=UPI00325AA463
MSALIIRTDSVLVDPPADTPVFSNVPYSAQMEFLAKRLSAKNTVLQPVKIPFEVQGAAPANKRVFSGTGGADLPTYNVVDGIHCLQFNGVNGLRQEDLIDLVKGFSIAIVFKAPAYATLSNSRLVSFGSSIDDRAYIDIRSSGVYIAVGEATKPFIDMSKATDFQCIVVKFNGLNSRYVNNAGVIQNIEINDITAAKTSGLRMGFRLDTLTTEGFNGCIAGFKVFEDDLSDADLSMLHAEMKIAVGLDN